jgi:hypothetical protein
MSFTAFTPEDSVISSDVTVTPMWSNSITNLTSYITNSFQENSVAGNFYLDVYKDPFFVSAREVQFSIAYGHVSGSGSSYFNQLVPDKTPTRDIYGQFRSLIYGDENASFNFGTINAPCDEIIVLSINRACFKEAVLPGSLTLRLTSGSDSIVLTDDSTVSTTSTYVGTSRIYQLLSGSANNVSSSNYTISGSYGALIPDEGLILLNAKALRLPAGPLGGVGALFDTQSSFDVANLGITYNINNRIVYEMISSSAILPPTFSLQNYETISSRYFFVRVKNAEYNYTTNPTLIDNNGNLLFTQLIFSPQTYITTVGMYNNAGDLIAVAKLNKPLVKDFTKELLLRVKLDF